MVNNVVMLFLYVLIVSGECVIFFSDVNVIDE